MIHSFLFSRWINGIEHCCLHLIEIKISTGNHCQERSLNKIKRTKQKRQISYHEVDEDRLGLYR
jgi:hypothetical protein